MKSFYQYLAEAYEVGMNKRGHNSYFDAQALEDMNKGGEPFETIKAAALKMISDSNAKPENKQSGTAAVRATKSWSQLQNLVWQHILASVDNKVVKVGR